MRSAHDTTILQINASDRGGGAERVASNLLDAFRRRGFGSYLAVGRKQGDDAAVLPILASPSTGAKAAARRLRHGLAGAGRLSDRWAGVETFRYPATSGLFDLTPMAPDIVLAHNLHGGYFDLRVLRHLAARVPVVLSLHDGWLLSGHCAHSLACERWETGCGECPDLSIYPAVRRDATAGNWLRKRKILSGLPLHVVAPCRWLMDRVERSLVSSVTGERRVIPNGVDLTVFRPGDRAAARATFGLPSKARVLAFVASGPRTNPFKDFDLVRAAVAGMRPSRSGTPTILLALGDGGPSERWGDVEVRFVPFSWTSERIALAYRSADVYLHAARADTFPLTVLEALACGIPVVATAIGGIPEQVRSLPTIASGPAPPDMAAEEPTGILTPSGDAAALTSAVERVLEDHDLQGRLGAAAAADAKTRFDLEHQCDAYIRWFEDVLAATSLPTPEHHEAV
jgi:glycosyltransferase involved in cell wall biosynthesis